MRTRLSVLTRQKSHAADHVMHWQGKADAKGAVKYLTKLFRPMLNFDAHRKAQSERYNYISGHSFKNYKITGS